MLYEVRFAGLGGQGAVTAGKLLAEACAYEGRYVTQTQFYVGVIRDGAAVSNVRISDEPIDFPWVIHPNALMLFAQPVVASNVPDLADGAVVVIDPLRVTDLVIPAEKQARVLELPITELADQAGKRVVGNVVAFAAMATVLELCSEESIVRAVRENVPEGTEELNLKAAQIGLAAASSLSLTAGQE